MSDTHERAVYRVIPGDGGWKVEGRGRLASRVHAARVDAVEEAVDLARYDVPSLLQVLGQGGLVEAERTFDQHPAVVGRIEGATTDPALPAGPSYLATTW